MNLMFLKIMIHHNQHIALGQMTLGSIYQCAYGILPLVLSSCSLNMINVKYLFLHY